MAEEKLIKTQTSTAIEFGGVLRVEPRPIVFEMDDRLDSQQDVQGVVRVRKYPGDPSPESPGTIVEDSITYETTQGQVFETSEIRSKSVFGRLVFTGQDRVRLPYPITQNFQLDQVGRYYDPNGREISNPKFQVNTALSEVWAKQPVIGAVEYEYLTNYRILRYFPQTYLGIENRFVWNSGSYGSIVARYNLWTVPTGVPREAIPAVVFEVQPPEALNIEYELYRLESNVIVNEDGTWEKPSNWPTSGTFTGITDPNLQLDPDAPSLELTRVHEIASFTLQDFEARLRDTGSQQVQNLPLSFNNLERIQPTTPLDAAIHKQIFGYADKLQPPSKEYLRSVRDFRQPRMRIIRYDHKLEKPFDTEYGTYNLPKRTVVIPTPLGVIQFTGGYKIQLKASRGRVPDTSSLARTIVNKNDAAQDLQAAVTNNALYKAWAAIDWPAIRRAIQAQYPSNQYALDLTELVP